MKKPLLFELWNLRVDVINDIYMEGQKNALYLRNCVIIVINNVDVHYCFQFIWDVIVGCCCKLFIYIF